MQFGGGSNSGKRRDRAGWLAMAAAGAMLGGCSTPWSKGPCDTCVPPNTFACAYHHFWDNLVTRDTAHHCAMKDLKDCGKTSHHFKSGFVRAYEDLALGRYAAVPPVPPSKYWTAYYRSCAGQHAVDDWFAGYRAGLEIGLQSGVSRFNRVDAPGNAYCGPLANGVPGEVFYPDYPPPAGGVVGDRSAAPQGTVFPARHTEPHGFGWR